MAACERIFVKWQTPEEELLGVARLLEAFEHRRINEAHELAIAVPNMTWALQAQRACDAAGIKTSIQAGRVHLSKAAAGRLALIELLANPADESLRAQFLASGYTESDLDETIAQYQNAKASTLVRVAELRKCPELRHALLHVCGDESAAETYRIIAEQLDNPTPAEGVEAAAIIPFTHVKGSYEQMWMIGCVEGLLPAAGAENTDDEAAMSEAEYAAFAHLADHVNKRLYYSGFATAEVSFARSAQLHFVRTKQQAGQQIAICRPTPFFSKFGHERPSTLGGQALLRKYQLN